MYQSSVNVLRGVFEGLNVVRRSSFHLIKYYENAGAQLEGASDNLSQKNEIV